MVCWDFYWIYRNSVGSTNVLSIVVLFCYYAAKFNGCFLVWSFLSLECPSLASRQTPAYPSKPTSSIPSSKKPSLTMPCPWGLP